MTEHPLTDEICKGIQLHVSAQIFFHRDEDCLRAAADWQLEQVIEWLKDNMRKHVYQDYYGADEQQEVFKCLEDLKKAMRPTQEQSGRKGALDALDRLYEENSEGLKRLADTTQENS